MHDKKVKLFDCVIEKKESISTNLGEVFTDGKTELKFAAKDGYIVVKELQIEGKKRMKTEDFLRGYRWVN